MSSRASLPREITSYDLLKMFAVLAMLVDHVGFFFFPDDLWWRVVGRMCVPIWFFLIGYARSRDIGPRMWIGGALLLSVDLLCGKYLLPVNILFTMVAIRLVIDPLMRRVARAGAHSLWVLGVVLVATYIPSAMVLEYGTQGLILAMVGWFMRNQDDAARGSLSPATVDRFFMFAYITFVMIQTVSFAFLQPQFLALAFGSLLVFGAIYFFKPVSYPKATAILGGLSAVPRFFGRWTLEIYVGHIVLLDLIVAATQPDRFQFLNPHLTGAGFMQATVQAAAQAATP